MDPTGDTAKAPSGTERARAFLPSKDFAVSKAFYVSLGFTLDFEGDDVAIFATGESEFLLTPFYQKEYAENFMMQMLVDNLDVWWTRISLLNLPKHFGVPAPRDPAVQPWGLRVAYIVDPSGVLWHFAERPGGGRVV
jgi:catechol 2,3-dioxygenase-like lactoylglutathione lyase family enzyme